MNVPFGKQQGTILDYEDSHFPHTKSSIILAAQSWKSEKLADGVEIIHGDCRDVLPTIESAAHVITDPPYEAEAHMPMRRTQRSINTGTNDALDFAPITSDVREFFANWCGERCEGWSLTFCQVEGALLWRNAMAEAGSRYNRTMAWIKPDSSPQFDGHGPAQGYECIFAGWFGKGASRWNAGGKRGVYQHNTNGPLREGTHPTEKPLKLMLELINDFASEDGLIVDPFMGSGTTGVAALRLGRRFIGIERDEKYFNVARRRIEKEMSQPSLFAPAPPRSVQQPLFN